jgi:hypothetical protein
MIEEKTEGLDTDGFRERVVAFLEERGVPTNHPTVEVRIADVTTWWRVVRDFEKTVQKDGVTLARKPLPAGSGDKATPPADWKPHPAVEAMAKAWERLRRAVKELEDMCGQTVAPAPTDLGSEMKPLIEQTRGVLEDALEFERKKRERAARKRKALESEKKTQQTLKAADAETQDKTE